MPTTLWSRWHRRLAGVLPAALLLLLLFTPAWSADAPATPAATPVAAPAAPVTATAASAPTGVKLPLKNPGFENGLDGWHAMPTTHGAQVSAERGPAHAGKAVLQLAGEDTTNPWIAQGLGDLKPLAVYEASAFMRRVSGDGRPALKLEFYDADDHYLCGFYGLAPTTLAGDWLPVLVRGQAPETAAKVALILRLIGPGTATFDDVTLSMISPPPALILSPARLVQPAQGGATVTLGARLLVEKPTGEPHATLSGGPLPRPVSLAAVQVKPDASGALTFAIPLPATVAPGAYQLRVTWGPLPAAAMELVLLPSGSRPALVDKSGRFLRAGKPYFPIGLYHTTPADFPRVAAAGFTVVEVAPPASADELEATASAATGVKLLLAVPLYPALASPEAADAATTTVKALSSNEAIFGWLLADEPELQPAAAANVPDLFLRVRQADPEHPALLNLGPGADLAAWSPLADALLVSLLPTKGDTPAALAARVAQVAAALKASGRPWLGVVPAGWSGRTLTTGQARFYLYQLLAAGAQGAFWFSLREGQWDLTASPLWADLPHLNAEAQELSAALAGGAEYPGVEISAAGVTARAVKQGSQAWLLLFNPGDTGAAGYLRVADPVAKAEYVEGGGKPKVTNRTVSFELPAGGARALKLTLEAAPAPKPTPSEEPEPEKPTP